MSCARRTALDIAEKIEEWSDNCFTKTLPNITAAVDTALTLLIRP
jgi:hypothetical protein